MSTLVVEKVHDREDRLLIAVTKASADIVHRVRSWLAQGRVKPEIARMGYQELKDLGFPTVLTAR